MYTIIFGCGNIGKKTLLFLGKDRVNYFCDNNPNIIGQYIEGIKIISYSQLLNIIKNNDILLVLGVNSHNAEVLAEQLENDNVYDFVVASEIPGFYENKIISQDIFNNLHIKETRQSYYIKYLKTRLENEKKKNDYFKRHASIYHMSPAVGKLREYQLSVLDRVSKTISFLNENCPIKCWITGGTLIGKLRHDGFVPWDDDIDFGILRNDVYKLLDFFKNYSTVLIYGKKRTSDLNESYKSDISVYETIEEVTSKYNNTYFLYIFPDFIRIYIKENNKLEVALELFPFDFYNEDISIQEYANYVSDGFMKKRELTSREWFDYCYDKVENGGIVSFTPTNKILPGIDSFLYRGLWNIENFLEYDTIFPLKEIKFENKHFFAPNNEKKYIIHEYPNWDEFPNDVGKADDKYYGNE